MLKYRLIFGVMIVAAFVGIIALDVALAARWPRETLSAPAGTCIAVITVVILPFALREMQQLLASENVTISMRICVAASILCAIWPWLEQVATSEVVRQLGPESPWHFLSRWFGTVKPHYLVPTVLAMSLVGAVIMHSRKQRIDGAMANAGGSLLAIVYLGVLPSFLLPIVLTHGAWMMLAICLVVKSADIGAYATGLTIGRHKLIPWLSPGKTVEGFLGGLALAAICGAIAAACFERFTWPQGLVAGLLLGAVGQLGDLFESLLKRDAGVKDSGRVPGFGGILDILDSPLLAAPVAYWLLKLLVVAKP